MFAAWPEADGLPAAVGVTRVGAGVGAAVCAVGRGAAWVGAADERGHRRKAPSPASASTMTAKATFRCADVRSIGPGSYFRRRTGRSQNGLGGPASAGRSCPAGAAPPAGFDTPGEAGGGCCLLAGLSSAGTRAPPERLNGPPSPQVVGLDGAGCLAGAGAGAGARAGAGALAGAGCLAGAGAWAGARAGADARAGAGALAGSGARAGAGAVAGAGLRAGVGARAGAEAGAGVGAGARAGAGVRDGADVRAGGPSLADCLADAAGWPRGAVSGQRGLPGDVPPRDQLVACGGTASPSRGGRTSGGASRPAPLLPFPSPRARPRLAAPAPDSEPGCDVSWASA